MSGLLLKGGRVVDPARAIDDVLDVLIESGRVAEVGSRVAARGAEVVDARGLVVCPGFIDLHAHLGEPGREDRETIATGTRAAAAGGFTAVCALADTEPANDHAGIARSLKARAQAEGAVRVHLVAALSKGRAGAELAEYGDLAEAGCVAVSDAPSPVADSRVLRRALEYARAFSLTVIERADDPALTGGAVMNEGPVATLLGLRGTPPAAEAMAVERDLLLAELTGGRLHLAQVSAAASVGAIRRAKARGIAVTAEVSPHHLLLTDRLVKESGYDTASKTRPPLRGEADREALIAALRDGTLDAIATGHEPATVDEKNVEYDQAAFGIVGLETAVALALDRLVGPRLLELGRVVELLSSGPARALALPGGSLGPGAPGDVTVLDLQRKRTVDSARFASKGRSTPFAGSVLRGWPAMTVVGGKVVFKDPKAAWS
jgi:dihydroorotase